MRYRHQEALATSVMLGHASQTSGAMQNVHDKPCIHLPHPDIFAFDRQPLYSKGFSVRKQVRFLNARYGKEISSLPILTRCVYFGNLCC